MVVVLQNVIFQSFEIGRFWSWVYLFAIKLLSKSRTEHSVGKLELLRISPVYIVLYE